ncbi:MAG: DUF805 domain-containing protein [Marinicaulis sp.]|nr:DUF805 domain-containing protein [Marinicaulis sp.]
MIKKLISPNGRLSRGGCWLWGVLILSLIWFGSFAIDFYVFGVVYFDPKYFEDFDRAFLTVFSDYVAPALVIPGTILAIQRLHDLGLISWWCVVFTLITYALGEFGIIYAMHDSSGFLLGVMGDQPLFATEWLQQIVHSLPVYIASLAMITTMILSFFVLYLLLVAPGAIGPNRFGQDPLSDYHERQQLRGQKEEPAPWLD